MEKNKLTLQELKAIECYPELLQLAERVQKAVSVRLDEKKRATSVLLPPPEIVILSK
jgi:hypothetical protein